MNKTTSKQKLQHPNGITVTLHIHNKKILVKAPMPCSATTLKDLISIETHKVHAKAVYFETTNQDWITDYKLQCGIGWIRGNCAMKGVMRKKGDDILRGINGYSVLKCIGVGGFSKVYLARDKNTGIFFAAKFTEKEKIMDKI